MNFRLSIHDAQEIICSAVTIRSHIAYEYRVTRVTACIQNIRLGHSARTLFAMLAAAYANLLSLLKFFVFLAICNPVFGIGPCSMEVSGRFVPHFKSSSSLSEQYSVPSVAFCCPTHLHSYVFTFY